MPIAPYDSMCTLLAPNLRFRMFKPTGPEATLSAACNVHLRPAAAKSLSKKQQLKASLKKS